MGYFQMGGYSQLEMKLEVVQVTRGWRGRGMRPHWQLRAPVLSPFMLHLPNASLLFILCLGLFNPLASQVPESPGFSAHSLSSSSLVDIILICGGASYLSYLLPISSKQRKTKNKKELISQAQLLYWVRDCTRYWELTCICIFKI